jgi:hypothetical protein
VSRRLPWFVLVAWPVFPGVAEACSTCMDPSEGSRTLLWVTIFLSLLPLTLLGSIGGYIWWRSRGAAALATTPALPPVESR